MSADELDVDAELLAMAGDDSSDDESDAPHDAADVLDQTQVIHEGPRTPSEEPKPSVEKAPVDEPPPSARRGVAQKVRKRRKKTEKGRRREILDELDDLDDGSPSPRASLGSDAMSESPASADAPGSPILDDSPDEAPIYPLEGKFLSSEDRRTILALPEIERESILADRAAEVLKRQQDLQLQKALASSSAAAAAASKQQKRKAAAADLDDGSVRKSSRAKTEKSAGRSALDDYKKAREAKGAERTSRFDVGGRAGKRSRSASSASERDADGESEVEWAEPSFTGGRGRDEPAAELKDFDRCRIGRTAFAKICFYPNFEETMKGCFARVSIGVNRDTGMNMYRMTQIKGFTSGKPYALEQPNGKTFHTDQYALVSHGLSEKPWPFSACSDSPLTESEFQHYKATLEKEHIRMPKRMWLHQKLDDLHLFLNIKWTDGVLQGKFARQREMEKRVDPANAVNVKRQAILQRKHEAEEAEDAEEAARCDAELAALENNAATNGVMKPKSSPAKPVAAPTRSQQDSLALVNQKNRNRNADDVRKALLEERKKLHRERERALAEAKAKAEAAAAEAERKKAEGLLGVPSADLTDLFGSDISRAGTPMSGASTPIIRRSRAGTPLAGVKKEKSGLGMLLGKKKKIDDELGGLDLGIDVEI